MSERSDQIARLPSVYDDEDKKYNEKFYHETYSTIDQILPRLYLSNDYVARNRKILNDNKITHILNLTSNIPNMYEPDIVYKKIIIFDFESQNISTYLEINLKRKGLSKASCI